jgi:hypothetical protein
VNTPRACRAREILNGLLAVASAAVRKTMVPAAMIPVAMIPAVVPPAMVPAAPAAIIESERAGEQEDRRVSQRTDDDARHRTGNWQGQGRRAGEKLSPLGAAVDGTVLVRIDLAPRPIPAVPL